MEFNIEELFVETENGRFPIDAEIIKKYHLKKGTLSPFTRMSITGTGGQVTEKQQKSENKGKEDVSMEKDGGVMLTTSEILDFSEGSDS